MQDTNTNTLFCENQIQIQIQIRIWTQPCYGVVVTSNLKLVVASWNVACGLQISF